MCIFASLTYTKNVKNMEKADNGQVRSRRDNFKERMVGKYPERNFDDDEELFGQISDDYDNYDKELAGYKEREGQFADMFTSDPRSASFLTNWKNGSDPAVEMVRQFGTDIKDAIDDPEKLEVIAEANKEYLERVAKEKELDETYKKNVAESLQMLTDLQDKNGLTDDEVDAAMELLMTIIKDGVMGKFSAESIDMAMKAINHDADVENAGYEGEVRGKNAKITERLRKQQGGDGLPHLNGKNNAGTPQRRRSSLFQMAEEAR